MTSYLYHAYGLSIRVPFACPALPPSPAVPQPAACGGADVVVREGPVPRRLHSPWAGEAFWEAAPGAFLLRGGRQAGRFLVETGNVTFERNPGCDDAALARCFANCVLAAVLRQRGLLVLHANAVVTPGGVIVIGGESGSGKSTTLGALLNEGCWMLSDDLTVLRGGSPGAVDVLPGMPQLHLTQSVAEGLGYRVEPAQLQPWRRMKAAIPVRDGMAREPGRLLALYLLGMSDDDQVEASQVSGGGKFRLLHECLYGPMFAQEHPALFPLLTDVVTGVPFFSLRRPSRRWSADEVARAILGGTAAVGR